MTTHPTPLLSEIKQTPSRDEKITLIAEHFHAIMDTLGLDLTDPSLSKTPMRVARMFVDEIFSGLDPETFPTPSFIENELDGGIVTVKAHVTSFCEHHFVPMDGEAEISYIPRKKLIGLSKIPRIVQHLARRPQVQERLTSQIAHTISELLETPDVSVTMTLKHYCVIARGVSDHSSTTTTHLKLGSFQ